jgi:hypothetical protein
MKTYPSIDRDIRFGETVYAFDKIDGSNIRAEWTKKNKFHKFGTRKQLISKACIRKGEIIGQGDRSNWGEAVRLVQEKYEKDLHDIFVKKRFLKATCFFEFGGESSFAGRHFDEEHTVTLFDVSVHKKGYILPREYLKLFGDLDIARLLYYGFITESFVDSVRNGELEGMTFEGVVCKMAQYKTPGVTDMFKVKSFAWLDRLKSYCGNDELLFENLK